MLHPIDEFRIVLKVHETAHSHAIALRYPPGNVQDHLKDCDYPKINRHFGANALRCPDPMGQIESGVGVNPSYGVRIK